MLDNHIQWEGYRISWKIDNAIHLNPVRISLSSPNSSRSFSLCLRKEVSHCCCGTSEVIMSRFNFYQFRYISLTTGRLDQFYLGVHVLFQNFSPLSDDEEELKNVDAGHVHEELWSLYFGPDGFPPVRSWSPKFWRSLHFHKGPSISVCEFVSSLWLAECIKSKIQWPHLLADLRICHLCPIHVRRFCNNYQVM